MAQAGSYSGPDRRAPLVSRGDPAVVRRLAVGGLVFLALWTGSVILARSQAAETQHALLALARSFAGALFLAGGALQFATWRITGTAASAIMSVALVTLGVGLPLFATVGYIQGETDLLGSDRLLVDAVLIGLAGYGLGAPAVVSRLRPARLIVPIIAGYLLVGGISIVGAAAVEVQSSAWVLGAVVGESIVATSWLALGIGYLVAARCRSSPARGWLGAACLLLAVSGIARALFGTALTGFGIRAGSQLLGGMVAASLAASWLWRLQTARGTRALALTGALDDVRSSLTRAEGERRQRLHDAQTAILAVAGATRLLGRRDPVVTIDTGRLSRLVDAELTRLGSILDPASSSEVSRFHPAEIIEPLLLAHSLAGADIRADLGPGCALGRPQATATAVANLLSNAREHAPGSTVVVSVRTLGEAVVIAVEDDGPGIPSEVRTLVLERAVRGRWTWPGGRGLGLPAAAEAMADQGGSLTISGGPRGGTSVVLTLPRAHSRPGAESPDPAEDGPAQARLAEPAAVEPWERPRSGSTRTDDDLVAAGSRPRTVGDP